jgi:hypothetical protein
MSNHEWLEPNPIIRADLTQTKEHPVRMDNLAIDWK